MGANDKVAATFHGADPLDQIRARLEAATPGPWVNDPHGIYGGEGQNMEIIEGEVGCGSYCYGGTARMVIKPSDRELIGHAPTDIRRLLNALDAVLEHIGWAEVNKAHWVSANAVRTKINNALGD